MNRWPQLCTVMLFPALGCAPRESAPPTHLAPKACPGPDIDKCKRKAFAKETRERWKREQEEREREERRNAFVNRQQ